MWGRGCPSWVILGILVGGGLFLSSGVGSCLWAPQAVVLWKWAFLFPWLLLAGLLFFPPRRFLVTVCCLPVCLALGILLPCISGSKCLWSECFLNILPLLPTTEINAANTVAAPHLRPFNVSPKEMTVIVPWALENNQCCPSPFACSVGGVAAAKLVSILSLCS